MTDEEWLKSPAYAKMLAEEKISLARGLGLIDRGKYLTSRLAEMTRTGDNMSKDEAIRRAFFEGACAAFIGTFLAVDIPAEKQNILDSLWIEIQKGLGNPP
jgi:hypothetical protein